MQNLSLRFVLKKYNKNASELMELKNKNQYFIAFKNSLIRYKNKKETRYLSLNIRKNVISTSEPTMGAARWQANG